MAIRITTVHVSSGFLLACLLQGDLVLCGIRRMLQRMLQRFRLHVENPQNFATIDRDKFMGNARKGADPFEEGCPARVVASGVFPARALQAPLVISFN